MAARTAAAMAQTIKAKRIEIRAATPASVRRIWEESFGQADVIEADEILLIAGNQQRVTPTTRKRKRRSI